MQTASHLLQPALVVSPDMKVEALARLLLSTESDGACVIDEGRLVGVVTVMDLLFKQRLVQKSADEAGHTTWEQQTRTIAGALTRDIMGAHPVCVRANDGLDKVATLMVDQNLTMVPVVEHGALMGVVTKRGLLAASGLATDADET